MWLPKRPNSLEEAKTKSSYVQDNVLKILYVRGNCRGIEFSEVLKLPFALIEPELRRMRDADYLAPVGGNGIGGYEGLDFALSASGRAFAADVYQRSSHIGPAAVHLSDYVESVKKQKLPQRFVKKEQLDAAFGDIVVSPEFLGQLGPAINSGGPVFLHGKPGNGKTTIAERLARVFRQGIFVPHSIQCDGQIIQFFDEKVHVPVPVHMLTPDHPVRNDPRSVDPRWVYVFRPFIVVGGELTLEMLDLIFQNGQMYYEAPFQLKANCGVLLVDDFGRQIVTPKDFLNRWIYPLEKGVDFLTLITGKKIEVPFELTLLFSTNLEPSELGDEAFWRRIRYKIAIPNPSEEEFTKIFKAVCQKEKIVFDDAAFQHLVSKYYKGAGREYRSVHARDFLGQMKDQIFYHGKEPKLTTELVDMVGALYFGDKPKAKAKAA